MKKNVGFARKMYTYIGLMNDGMLEWDSIHCKIEMDISFVKIPNSCARRSLLMQIKHK